MGHFSFGRKESEKQFRFWNVQEVHASGVLRLTCICRCCQPASQYNCPCNHRSATHKWPYPITPAESFILVCFLDWRFLAGQSVKWIWFAGWASRKWTGSQMLISTEKMPAAVPLPACACCEKNRQIDTASPHPGEAGHDGHGLLCWPWYCCCVWVVGHWDRGSRKRRQIHSTTNTLSSCSYGNKGGVRFILLPEGRAEVFLPSEIITPLIDRIPYKVSWVWLSPHLFGVYM